MPSVEILPAAGSQPTCDWVYFATTAKFSGSVTKEFVGKHKVIVRSFHDSARQRIANVQHLRVGDRVLLVHGGKGKPYGALYACAIAAAKVPLLSKGDEFDAFTLIDQSLDDSLIAGRYPRDPVLKRFTGLCITNIEDLLETPAIILRQAGNNAIWRWDDVFSR